MNHNYLTLSSDNLLSFFKTRVCAVDLNLLICANSVVVVGYRNLFTYKQ
jgi:hypothetical protein